VPENNRRPFRCIGLNVINVLQKKIQHVSLKDLTLWEEVDLGEGMAGATSSVYGTDPKYAFQNLDEKHWFSKEGLPQSIWMRYPKEHTVSKIGFTPYENDIAPDQFDIVGSWNCADPWTTLLHVKSSGFSNNLNNDGFKSWTVPENNRRSFRCIGLNVINVLQKKTQHVSLKDLTLWEEVDLGEGKREN